MTRPNATITVSFEAIHKALDLPAEVSLLWVSKSEENSFHGRVCFVVLDTRRTQPSEGQRILNYDVDEIVGNDE